MVVVAVGAHPDDVEFGCFGTLAKLSKKHEIHIFIFSAGEIGGPRETRIKEAKESAALIGAEVTVFGYMNGKIPIDADSVEILKKQIDALNPEVMFAPYLEDTHQGHRAVSRIAVSSCRYVPKILFYELPQTERFEPNYYVDVTEHFEVKAKAVRCHRSQERKPYYDIEGIRGRAAARAFKVFHPGRLFEAFVLYKFVEGVCR